MFMSVIATLKYCTFCIFSPLSIQSYYMSLKKYNFNIWKKIFTEIEQASITVFFIISPVN